jgi:hypothetical protein
MTGPMDPLDPLDPVGALPVRGAPSGAPDAGDALDALLDAVGDLLAEPDDDIAWTLAPLDDEPLAGVLAPGDGDDGGAGALLDDVDGAWTADADMDLPDLDDAPAAGVVDALDPHGHAQAAAGIDALEPVATASGAHHIDLEHDDRLDVDLDLDLDLDEDVDVVWPADGDDLDGPDWIDLPRHAGLHAGLDADHDPLGLHAADDEDDLDLDEDEGPDDLG